MLLMAVQGFWAENSSAWVDLNTEIQVDGTG